MAGSQLTNVDISDLEEDQELILVNKRLFRCNKYLPSKSRVFNYAEKFGLGKPTFNLTVLNPNNAEWITYRARLSLENLKSEGSGRTKRKAEAAASYKYMNNDYLAGGNSLQLGNPVIAPDTKYPPSKKLKSQMKVEKMLARKRAEVSDAAATETITMIVAQT